MKIQQIPTSSVIPYERNPRVNDHAVDAVAESIKQFGFRQPIVCDETMTVIVGHTRLKAAIKLGLETVPVHVAEGLTEAQARAYRLADNKVGEAATWDFDLLAVELGEIADLGVDMGEFGFMDGEIERIDAGLGATPEGLTDADAVPEPQAEVVTQPGDVWVMGQHRLLCGDSTVAESYERLMRGAAADMVFTDPPYNVNYANSAKDKMRGKDRAILNDNLGDGFYDFLLAALTPTVAHCRGGIYVAMSSSELDVTTLIAAEKSGRVALLIELDPKYVDVIVRRWEDFTGKQATREHDGKEFDQC